MNIVSRQNTPVSAQQCVSALMSAWPSSGGVLTRELATSLLALCFIETGSGKSMQNYSPGNITASSAWTGDAWRPTWFTITDSSSQRDKDLNAAMQKGQAPSAFRAYSDLAEGFEDFSRVLITQFPEVIAAGRSGDADQFRVALSKKYSGDYKNIAATKTFQQLFQTFTPLVQDLPPELVRPAPAPPLSHGPQSSPLAGLSLPLPSLFQGMGGELVGKWQSFLKLNVDERFGPLTKAATQAFQAQNLLKPDGVVGPLTWEKALGKAQ